MKKRLFAILLALTLLLALTGGCGGAPASSAASQEASGAEPPASEAEAEPEAEAESAESAGAESAASQPSDSAPAPESAAEEEPSAPEEEAPVFDLDQQPMVDLPLADGDVSISVWLGGLPMDCPAESWADNYAMQELVKRTGVDIEFVEVAPPTMTETFNLMIAGGDYTDVFCSAAGLYSGGGEAMIQDEVIIDLMPYIEEFAPSYSWLRSVDPNFASDTVTDSGHMPSLYGYQYNTLGATSGLQTRQDWLDALGMDVPQTLDQFEEMLLAFKNEGFSSTPLAFQMTGLIAGTEAAYGVLGSSDSDLGSWCVKDGELIYTYTDDGFREYLEMIEKWYAEGLIHPDLLTGSMIDSSRVLDGTYGAFADDAERMSTYEDWAPVEGFKLTAVPQLKLTEDGPDLEAGKTVRSTCGESYTISTACENPEIALGLLDYLYSHEGSVLCNYGIEGLSFEYNAEGVPEFTDLIMNNPDGYSFSMICQVYTYNSQGCLGDKAKLLQVYTEGQVDACAVWLENTVPSENDNRGYWTLTTEEASEFAAVYSDIETYVQQMVPDFFTGAASLETDWDTYVANVESMNISVCTDMVAAARERYNSRSSE